MSRIICFGIMLLPVFWWHLGRNLSVIASPVLNQEVKQAVNQTEPTSYLIAARDDKIQDCIRLGNCRN
ncbi:MAG: hypothetical protein IGS39_07720 [Calothrix sp. C42_A2020_038]|nr:hypothetical protein [Calothrix sp. C42_A2020_038]